MPLLSSQFSEEYKKDQQASMLNDWYNYNLYGSVLNLICF